MKFFFFSFILLLSTLQAKDYTKNQDVIDFIEMMSTKYDFNKEYLNTLFSDVILQEVPLKLFQPQVYVKPTKELALLYPKYGAWDRYVKHKITDKRVSDGSLFITKYKKIFNEVEKKYGVPAEYIAAIIGIETVYGENVGKYPIFDTLTTLAFEENRRNKFFKSELEEFILLTYKAKIDVKTPKGSYAGAMGLGQFMPSNYLYYGIDYNKDGSINLYHPEDTIASIANYLKKNGWKKNEVVATRVNYEGERFTKYKTGYNIKYDRKDLKGIYLRDKNWKYNDKIRLIKLNKEQYDELWYAARNFYVITRYNHSAYYAMSVHQLAQKIKDNLEKTKSKKS